MIRSIGLSLLLCLSCNGLAADTSTVKGSFTCRYFGESSLESFKGRGRGNNFEIAADAKLMEFSLDVHKLSSNSSGRDDCMYKMFKTRRYPSIKAQADMAKFQEVLTEGSDKLPMKFIITGEEKILVGKVKDYEKTEEETTFRCTYDLSVYDFDLEPPSSAFGVIRASPYVQFILKFRVKA